MCFISRWPLLEKAFRMFGRPVVVVDLESTGGNLYEDRVTEVALVKFDAGRVERYECLVNPEKPIPGFVARLTGITDEMVASAPVFGEIAGGLYEMLKGCVLLAHNSRFDYTFLKHEFARAGMGFGAPALCTVQLSRKLYPQFYKHSLDSIIERTGIVTEERHRALSDVLVLCDYLEYSLQDADVGAWCGRCFDLMNPKLLPSGLPEQLAEQLYGLPDSDGALVCFDGSSGVLYIGTCERAYSETAALLCSGKVPFDVGSVARIEFVPAVGRLDAHRKKALLVRKYGADVYVSTKNLLKTFTTVCFEREKGGLRARLQVLKNGCMVAPPKGLFVNKKAAKRALAAWAAEYAVCPSAAGILPDGYAEGEPCPVHVSGKCGDDCHGFQTASDSEHYVLKCAEKLPVLDWGRAHEVEIVEENPLTHERVVLHCMGGALELEEGVWYFDRDLPDILKAKFKTGKQFVRELG